MSRRAGVTLTEVLIAIFVTAIGLLALLVLFPVGALNMAQAIKDDRTGHCAADAKALANFWDLRHDSMQLPYPPPNPAGSYISFWQNPTNPPPGAYTTPSGWGCNAQFLPVTAGPSYPVFIDPIGYQTFSSVPLGGTSTGIPRVMPRFLQDYTINSALGSAPPAPANQNQQITRWMTMLDDLSFNASGTPDNIGGTTTLIRETRYSYAYIGRIPDLSAPPPIPVELTVLVYNKRAVQTDANGNPLGEVYYGPPLGGAAASYAVSFPQSNVVTVAWASGAAAPTVKRGSWIMDASYLTSSPGAATPTVTPPTAYCYRVINVSDPYTVSNPFPGQAVDLELQTNIRPPAARAGASQPQNAIILLEDVAEVFPLGAS